MANQPLDLPPTWEQIDLSATGTLMVIGATDTGKSTFAQYLYRRLCVEPARRVAYLDGDPGQSTLGPPTTMTLALGKRGDDAFPPAGQRWRRFIQATSPRGHMLPMLVGAARLVQAAREAGADVLIYDTSGFVGTPDGGAHLKHAKIELLRPSVVFALQRDQELEAAIAPLRHSRHVRLIELRPSPATQRRDVATRQAHRASQFARYFNGARTLTVDWERLAVFPVPRFSFHQLVALEDAEGFMLALGIVELADMKAKRVTLRAPLASLDGAQALRLGDVTLDPKTFRDQPL
jgi:polynucleotide 5'-kinase involved in rRNA processing